MSDKIPRLSGFLRRNRQKLLVSPKNQNKLRPSHGIPPGKTGTFVTRSTKHLIAAARELAAQADRLKFRPPVTHIYNPLDYAWSAHEKYLKKFGRGKKRVIFLGMNPGPFGMAQTGIPFGEIAAVRDWLGISAKIRKPELCNPKRPVHGFDCPHSEVSGRRLWGLFRERFGTPDKFFAEHFVTNYCPLAFVEKSGLNRTPNKLPPSEKAPLLEICDAHLRSVLEILEPEWLIGIGGFASDRANTIAGDLKIKAGQILHPSPASPAANRGWAKAATRQLIDLGVWR
jgi:single-strand selective monofunctional uracil DNA glycosylase